MEKHLKIVLKEMCSRVGADVEKIDFQKDGWFRKHEWTKEDEDNFQVWLSDYIHTNKEAREELSTIFANRKKYTDQFAAMFVFNFGWVYKKEETQ